MSRTQSALPFFAIGGIAQQWMLRILFVFAKLHPELGYMQGMNEILAPIVFVYGTDNSDEWAQGAEADAFFSFVTIMSSVKLLYLKSPTDPSKSGVDTQMTRLTLLLRQHDALLWQHLVSLRCISVSIVRLKLCVRLTQCVVSLYRTPLGSHRIYTASAGT